MYQRVKMAAIQVKRPSSSAAIIPAMKRAIVILAILLISCRSLAPIQTSTPLEVYEEVTPTLSPTATVAPVTPSLTPPPSSTPTPTSPVHTPAIPVQISGFSVHVHPDGGLYVGDQVSFEVIAPKGAELNDQEVTIQVGSSPEVVLGSAKFQPYGLEGRSQATQVWGWDTHGLSPGTYTFTFSIPTQAAAFTQTVTLQSESARPVVETGAHWASVESQCCVFNYITGTSAERDINKLLYVADQQAEDVISSFGITYTDTFTVTLLPRVLGHGGFANEEISISYLDENYAGSDFETVLHHEMVHILDKHLEGDLRPDLLVEGLAVYLTGGHYKREDLMPRAAALLDLPAADRGGNQGWYLPLKPLIENFYASQHEIGYVEAGALVEYMINRWGWEAFINFYRDIHAIENGSQFDALGAALLKHFRITPWELEQDFLAELRGQEYTPEQREDLRLTVYYYDTMRRYQVLLDPSAYFRTAWLLDNKEMRQREIVADYLRRPSEPVNIEIEGMLMAAQKHLLAGRFTDVDTILHSINSKLDLIEYPEIVIIPDGFLGINQSSETILLGSEG